MKRFLIFIILLSAIYAKGQVHVIRTNGTITPVDFDGSFRYSLKIPVVADTTSAFSHGGIDSLGLVIQVRSTGDWWKRDTVTGGGHKWTKFGAGGGSGTVNVSNSIVGDGSSGTPLNLSGDASAPGNSQYYGTNSSGTKGYNSLNKAAVGLPNADNTSDVNKPVSTAQATAIGLKIANFLNVTFLGYGPHAARPTTGPGLYYDTDSSSLFFVNTGVYSNLFPAFTMFLRSQAPGAAGDTSYIQAVGGNLLIAPFRDSAGSCIHHVVNPDGSYTWYSTCGTGSGFDSLTSQGGVFHTGAYNDSRYNAKMWTKAGNYLYPINTTDSVGVGTATPTANFSVVGKVDQTLADTTNTAGTRVANSLIVRLNGNPGTSSVNYAWNLQFASLGSTVHGKFNAVNINYDNAPGFLGTLNTANGIEFNPGNIGQVGTFTGLQLNDGNGTAGYNGIFSAMSAGTGKLFINHNGTAPSKFMGPIGINTGSPDASAWLDIPGTSKGVLIPRGTTAQRNAITSPATGLLFFNLDSAGSGRALQYYTGSAWIAQGGIGSGGGIAAVKTTMSVVGSGVVGDSVKLRNDVLTPGRGMAYMTRPAGDSAKGYYEIEENSYGFFYKKGTWADATTGFVNKGSLSVTATAGKLVVTGGATDYSKALLIDAPSQLDKWESGTIITVGTKNATATDGPIVGKYSLNGHAGSNSNLTVQFLMNSGANTGKISINGYLGVQLQISSASLTFSVGDSILISCERDGYNVVGTARNLTSNSNPIKVNYSFSTYLSESPAIMDNAGDYGVFGGGGNFTIDSLWSYTKYPKNARLYIGGDSKIAGYNVTNQEDRISDQLNNRIRTTINGGGGSDRLEELRLCIPQIIAMHPQQYWNLMGSNSIRFGDDSTTYCTLYDSINTVLRTAGIDVLTGVLYESSIDVSKLWNHILQVEPASKRINVFDPLKAAGCLAPDNIHLLSFGDSVAAHAAIRSGNIYGVNERYGTAANLFIRNQYRTPQTADYNITGNATANSYTAGNTKLVKDVSNEAVGYAVLGNVNTGPGFLQLADSSGSADAKRFDITSFSNHVYLRLLNDAANSATNVIDITRSSTTPSNIKFNTPVIINQASGVPLTFTPLANGDGLTGSFTVTGFVRPIVLNGSATSGMQLFMSNTSTNSSAYNNIFLSTASSAAGSPTFAVQNAGTGRQYYWGLNRNTDNWQLQTNGNFFSEWGGSSIALMIAKTTGQIYFGQASPSALNRMVNIKGTVNIAKDSLPISVAGSVMPVGQDTATGDLVRMPLSAAAIPTLQSVITNERAGGGGLARISKNDTVSGQNSFNWKFDSISAFTVNAASISLNSTATGTSSLVVNGPTIALLGGLLEQNITESASFTLTQANVVSHFVDLTTPSSNQTITLPSAGSNQGAWYKISNLSTSTSFSWSFGGVALLDASGNTVTAIPNGYTYEIFCAQNGSNWRIKNISYVGAGATGIPVAGSYSSTGTATTTFTVTMGVTQPNTTYKVGFAPTDALSAAPYYITNKTTTTFDVVYLSGLTGVVSFDWTVTP
jgi:hypothetical protein